MSRIDDLVEEASRLEESGCGRQALETWREAFKISRRPDVMTGLGRRYMLEGHYEQAETVLRQVVQEHPAHAEGFLCLGVLLKKTSRLDESKRFLQEGLALGEWAPAYVVLGDVHRQLDEREQARANFERAIMLEPRNDEAWYGLGLVSDEPEKAAEAFKEAVQACSENADAHRELAICYWRAGDMTEAERLMRRAVELNPEDDWSHYSLGQIVAKRELYVEAESEMRIALRLAPSIPLYSCGLGEVLTHQGRFDEAEAAYKTALALDVSYYLANLRYAQLLESRGYPQRAYTYAQRALEASPHDHRSQELLDRLRGRNS